ncbi:MAG: M60 family metallopeptidase [Verrucomicrobiota bacterium]
MTCLDAVPLMRGLTALRCGSCGHFHELGHTRQESGWTPDGTTGVTCDILTLHVFDKVCGIPPDKARKDSPRRK